MKDKGIKIKEIILNHIINNKKEYFLVLVLFIIGIFLGVLFVNNSETAQREEINTYLNNFIEKMKTTENVDTSSLLHTSIIQNLIFAVTIWFFGTTVIRNTSGIWISDLQRILSWIYNFIKCGCNGNVKRNIICNNNHIVAKFNIYTSNFSVSSKWL